jgi:hypothetical protein
MPTILEPLDAAIERGDVICSPRSAAWARAEPDEAEGSVQIDLNRGEEVDIEDPADERHGEDEQTEEEASRSSGASGPPPESEQQNEDLTNEELEELEEALGGADAGAQEVAVVSNAPPLQMTRLPVSLQPRVAVQREEEVEQPDTGGAASSGGQGGETETKELCRFSEGGTVVRLLHGRRRFVKGSPDIAAQLESKEHGKYAFWTALSVSGGSLLEALAQHGEQEWQRLMELGRVVTGAPSASRPAV